MTPRHEHRPLASYSPQALAEFRSRVAALLRYEDLLPTDLSVKLDLLHDDVSAAIRQGTPRPATFTPRPRGAAGPSPRGRA